MDIRNRSNPKEKKNHIRTFLFGDKVDKTRQKFTDFLKIMKENNIFIEIQDKKSYIGII